MSASKCFLEQEQGLHAKMCISTLQMQAQEAEQRAEAVEAAVQQAPPQSAIKLYVTSALTAVLSFAVVSGMHQLKCRTGCQTEVMH